MILIFVFLLEIYLTIRTPQKSFFQTLIRIILPNIKLLDRQS